MDQATSVDLGLAVKTASEPEETIYADEAIGEDSMGPIAKAVQPSAVPYYYPSKSLPTSTELLKKTMDQRREVYEKFEVLGQYFGVELNPYKGKQSFCRGCEYQIAPGDLRFRHIVCSNKCNASVKPKDKNLRTLDVCGRWHLDCLLREQVDGHDRFVHTNPSWKDITSTRQIAGFEDLSLEHQDIVMRKLGPRKRSINVPRSDLSYKYTPRPPPSVVLVEGEKEETIQNATPVLPFKKIKLSLGKSKSPTLVSAKSPIKSPNRPSPQLSPQFATLSQTTSPKLAPAPL
ncbi:hypothetical protein HDV03_002455 [Kappamyces sp. JEL0829]|nr:hypothetical protein HDV03_002455 [Kappamyces sp. JEL0829]